MSVPVWVEQANGKFVASLVGCPQVRAEGDTREAAVAGVDVALRTSAAAGELVWLDPPPAPAPKPWTDEERAVMRQVVAEIYRERDAQKAAEFAD